MLNCMDRYSNVGTYFSFLHFVFHPVSAVWVGSIQITCDERLDQSKPPSCLSCFQLDHLQCYCKERHDFGTSTKCYSKQLNTYVCFLIYKSVLKFKNSVYVHRVLSATQKNNIIQKQSTIMLLSAASQFMRSCLFLMQLDTLHFYKSFPETVPPSIRLFKVKIPSFRVKINKQYNWVK